MIHYITCFKFTQKYNRDQIIQFKFGLFKARRTTMDTDNPNCFVLPWEFNEFLSFNVMLNQSFLYEFLFNSVKWCSDCTHCFQKALNEATVFGFYLLNEFLLSNADWTILHFSCPNQLRLNRYQKISKKVFLRLACPLGMSFVAFRVIPVRLLCTIQQANDIDSRTLESVWC